MERVLQGQAAGAASTSCVDCGASVDGERCGQCGATQRAGPWRVRRVIARSPHGAMYLAEDEAGAKVALKELVFSLVPGTQELEAFEREARLLEALSHPRIPKFVGSFTVGTGVSTRLYLAQQYVTGQSLTQRLEHEHFDEAAAEAVARQALEVLAYLHERSPVVVHRDVKPDNFILGADGVLSLVDFGAARLVRAAGTHRATLVGTFGYMAPEQLGGTVDARSDLYGLGATLVHLLTRTPPERLMSPGLALDFRAHVNVSVKFERFLTRLVAPRPDERFASAKAALAYLDGTDAALAATQPRRLLVAGLALASVLAAAALVLVTARTAPPETEAKPALATAPRTLEPQRLAGLLGAGQSMAPGTRPVPLGSLMGGPVPAAGEVRFPWHLATWTFNKPGFYVLDESGHGHHARLPPGGFTNDFHGLSWDGSQDLTLPDSRTLATSGPFTLAIRMRGKGDEQATPSVLVSRGDVNGKFAWAVKWLPGRVLEFHVSDEAGVRSSVRAVLPTSREFGTTYFFYDPKTKKLAINSDCVNLAVGSVKAPPARELPEGSQVHLIQGFVGVMFEIDFHRGLMAPDASGGSCGYSLTRQDEE